MTSHPDILDLSRGQVIEPLPEQAWKALAAAERVTEYAPVAGLPELREAVAEHYRERTRLPVPVDDVTISAGARHGLFAVAAAIAAGGDVLVPRPHWSHYPKLLRLAGAELIPVPGDPATGWLADVPRLERTWTSRTKAVLINSPVNPTGAVYSEPAMRAIRHWAASRGVHLIIDDIYWAYGGAGAHHARVAPHEAVVGGAAKAHALAGLRVGWVLAAPPATAAVREIVAHTTGPVSTLSQAAVTAVLRDGAVHDRAGRMAALREQAVAVFSSVPMVRPLHPAGGIYLCLDVSELLRHRVFGATDDRVLCQAFAGHAGVHLRAGSTFGLPGHVRLCVAASPEALGKAADRMTTCLLAATRGAAGMRRGAP